jgi:hypothetical protein
VIAIVGLFSVVIGTVAACAAERFPAYVEALETGAGFLLIAGFALAGFALPTAV